LGHIVQSQNEYLKKGKASITGKKVEKLLWKTFKDSIGIKIDVPRFSLGNQFFVAQFWLFLDTEAIFSYIWLTLQSFPIQLVMASQPATLEQ
jgi:hypothetical protein